jgi:hypothetical protein
MKPFIPKLSKGYAECGNKAYSSILSFTERWGFWRAVSFFAIKFSFKPIQRDVGQQWRNHPALCIVTRYAK